MRRGNSLAAIFLKGMKFMAEYSNSAIVTVAAGQNVPFTEEANTGKPCIVHREGAGLVTLRGLTNQCRAKFKVSFGANIAIPTGGTVEAITAAISINGEALNASTATVTPAAAEDFFNIYVAAAQLRSIQDAEQGGFPGAGRADDREKLAVAQGEADIPQHLAGTLKLFADMDRLQHEIPPEDGHASIDFKSAWAARSPS